MRPVDVDDQDIVGSPDPTSDRRIFYGVMMRTKRSVTKKTRSALRGTWDFDQAYAIAEQIAQHVTHGWYWMVDDVRNAIVAERVFAVVRMSDRAERGVRAEDMDKLLRGVRLSLRLTTEEDEGLPCT